MKLLLHICCAVCACALVEKFRQSSIQVTGYFYNPNIHPYLEFQKRLRAVEVFADQDKLTVHYERSYGLRKFLRQIVGEEDNRCPLCYEMRLRRSAKFARDQGFDAFTSTLIISPHQKQSLIKTIGDDIGRSSGIKFHYEPSTELYSRTQELARKRRLYHQQYCGCIYSEYERYHKNKE